MPAELKGQSISLIPSDLRHDEFVKMFCETLKQLYSMSEEICNNVNFKIQIQMKNLESINERIKIVQTKVNKLKESRKATQVFSSTKYEYEYNWMDSSLQQIKKSTDPIDYIIANQLETISQDIKGFDNKVIDDKKQLLKLMTMVNNMITNKLCKLIGPSANDSRELGKVPSNLNSICSFMFFNSADNPYTQQSSSNITNTSAHLRIHSSSNQTTESLIGEAPFSIRERNKDFWNRGFKDSLNYNPNIGEVPTLDLPEFLPDLVGVADNIHYAGDFVQPIAPSIPLSLLSCLPELPTFTPSPTVQRGSKSLNNPPPPPPIMPQLVSTSIPIITDQVEKRKMPLIDVKNPVELKVDLTLVKTEPKTLDNVDATSIPLPPPPLPVLPKLNIPNNDLPRVDLMAEIRKKGGVANAELRSTKERIIKQPIASVEESPVDMMAELAKRLNLRRKGITAGNSSSRTEKSTFGIPQTPIDAMLNRMQLTENVDEEENKDDFD